MEKKKILVVDDEKQVTEILKEFFVGRGYELFIALSGENALEILKTVPLELVLLDIRMPGISGMEVLKLIKRDCPRTKVIVLTGYDEYKEGVKQLGADGFLTKPFGIRQLTDKVYEVLEGKIIEAKAAEKTDEKIKLLFVEGNNLVYSSLWGRFTLYGWTKDCEMQRAIGEQQALAGLSSFKPDIVLLNTTTLSASRCGALAGKILDAANPPKEIIIHGADVDEGAEKNEKVGMVGGSFLDPDYIERLGNEIKRVALAYNLKKPVRLGNTEFEEVERAREKKEKIKAQRKIELKNPANLSVNVQDIIAQELKIDKDKVAPKSRLVEDLGMDSLASFQLVMALEEDFDIEIPDEDAERLRTAQQIVDYIKKRIKP